MDFRLFDSHCHLHAAAYGADRAAVLGRLAEEGIGAVTIGTNFRTSSDAVELAERHEGVWAAIAVHPGHVHAPHHDLDETAEAPTPESFDPKKFAALAASPRVVAVGETGLDYYRLPEDEKERETIKEKQRANFIEHIRFAKSRNLPLSLHVRDAYEDALEIINGEKYFNGVMHSFTGTVTEAEKFLALGFYVSLTGAVTYPPRKGQPENALHPAARMVPMDRLLIETDAPWLAPAPLRGKRNEPVNVRLVAQKIAELRRLSYEEVAGQTARNAVRLFSLAAKNRS